MNKNIIFKIINLFIAALMITSVIKFIVSLNILNVTPLKYNIIIYSILILVSVLIIFETILIKNKIINILTIIFSLIITIIMFIGINKINSLNNFFEHIKYTKETNIYYVIINKSSNYKNINDLNGKKIGILNKNKNTDKVLVKLDKTIKYNTNNYDNTIMLLSDFNERKIDALIINSSALDIMFEYDESLKNKMKIIFEIPISNEVELIDAKNGAINVLISGIDVSGNIELVSRSDVNIIMTINPDKHEILLTSIPRDTYVYLHGIDSMKDKLTHSGIYGINMTKTTIEDFLNIKIDYYVRINFNSLVNVVDAIDGVDVYSDQAFSEYGYYFNQGYNHLDGTRALYYSRIRHVFSEGDRKRGEHQKQIIEAIINKVTSSKTILKNHDSFLNSMEGFFQTNIPSILIKKYVRNQLDTMDKWIIKSIAVNGYDSSGETYSMPGWILYLVIPDQNTIDYASHMINGMVQGKSFNEL